MRVVTGMLVQESNTFSRQRSDRASFERGCLLFDDACFPGIAGTRTELAGFIDAATQAEVDLVPTIAAWAPSGGAMIPSDFHRLVDELLDRIEGAGVVDGVLLALHGAWVSQDEPDADGWVLDRVRDLVGPHVPIVASLDLHANVTRRMIQSANALVGFRTYPHVDMFETGERAGELLFSALRSGQRLTTTVCKVPMIIPPENAQTDRGPLAEVLVAARQAESLTGIRSISIFTVQPWLDVPELGCAAVAVVDGEGEAPMASRDLATMLWERRKAFRVPLVAPDEAVQRALRVSEGPILLVDSADGTSSGSPGDSTSILRALLAVAPRAPAFLTLVDPLAARVAVESDGHDITLDVGGRLDPERHQPVSVTGRARRVRNALVTFSGGIGDGLTADMGNAAVLEVGEIKILLMENPVPCYDPALYRSASLEPRDAQIVVVKSPNNFRWAYRDVARDWIYVDCPGASSPRLESLRFERAPRPLYPFDDWDWHPWDNSVVEGTRRD